ncbi:MAG: hypothetical protein ACJ74J_18710 [Blastocatellia bacterium]
MMISHAQMTGAALQAAAEALARHLTIDQAVPGLADLGASPVLRVLGQSCFVEFTAVNVPGKVVWCNFDLAREAGFAVPPSNQLTASFHDQLIEALSFRVLRPNEEAGTRRTLTMYADKYWGVWPFLGGARAGFLPYGNFYIKGIGLTPAFKPSPDNDFDHSHGGLTMEEAMLEAIIGEVNTNIFTLGSARMLAIIDLGEQIVFPDGSKSAAVLGVRAGSQLRPAHLLAYPIQRNGLLFDRFVRMARETGQLVAHTHATYGTETIDIKQTLLRIIDDHARMASQQFRWRILHGALSSSNMELSGAMLDVITQTSQPRTAPIWMLKDCPDSVFGREHVERINELWHVFRELIKDITPARRPALNVRPIKLLLAMEKAYNRHLQVELLIATGIKRALALQVQADHPGLARRFTAVLLEMSRIKNPGSTNANVVSCESVSVLDVFHLLQHFSRDYFADPDADHREIIRALLKPVYKGNRYHAAKKRARVEELIGEFDGIYGELMKRCVSLAEAHYQDVESLKASVVSRAGFENELVSPLYRSSSLKALKQLIATYRANGDAMMLQDGMERWVAVSLRSVEGLLAQTRWWDSGNGHFLATRTLGGVNYRLSLRDGERRQPRLLISLKLEREGNGYRTPLPEIAALTRSQIRQLRYRFSFDGWASAGEVRARLVEDEHGQRNIHFDEISNLPLVGRLEGYARIEGHPANGRAPEMRCYAFAIPDRLELAALLAEPCPQGDAGDAARLFFAAP